MTESIATVSLDEFFSSMPTGSLDRAILNNLRGINHRQIKGMVPSNKKMSGYTFFVRPQLNLQTDNIRNVRKLTPLLSNKPSSIQRYIRCMLDPRMMESVNFFGQWSTQPLACPLVDNRNPFIPILTNNLETISGWPSISVPTFTSKPGLYNEAYSMVDGRVVNNETFDITANFVNTRGDPTLYLFYVWSLYMSYVFDGRLVPYLDFITENEIDYNTRIYRLVMDSTKEKVVEIAATNAAFPVGVPIGDGFDIGGDKPYIEANKEISMRFRCMGVDYFDDILIKEFNDTVSIFNPSMRDSKRDEDMVRVPTLFINNFNNRGYPRINPSTSELEWYVDQDVYEQALQKIMTRDALGRF